MEWIYGDTIEGRAKLASEVLLTSFQEDSLFGQQANVLKVAAAASDGLSEFDALHSALNALAHIPTPQDGEGE